MVGLELHNELSLTGALSLWFSVILSLGGFGLSLRAMEARFGRLSLTEYHGLYEHSPTLAVCFLLTGLASVGFPATIGFISTELLVDGAVEANPFVGMAVVAVAALNGIAVCAGLFPAVHRRRHVSTVSLGIGLPRADRRADAGRLDPGGRPVSAAWNLVAPACRRRNPGSAPVAGGHAQPSQPLRPARSIPLDRGRPAVTFYRPESCSFRLGPCALFSCEPARPENLT